MRKGRLPEQVQARRLGAGGDVGHVARRGRRGGDRDRRVHDARASANGLSRLFGPTERAVLRAGWAVARPRSRPPPAWSRRRIWRLLGRFGPVDLIGFHGQTLAHAPRRQGTCQAGDGAALAEALGRPVVWDFRSATWRLAGRARRWRRSIISPARGWIGADAPAVLSQPRRGREPDLGRSGAPRRPRRRARCWPSTPGRPMRRSTI
jgi:hypothetical protein